MKSKAFKRNVNVASSVVNVKSDIIPQEAPVNVTSNANVIKIVDVSVSVKSGE